MSDTPRTKAATRMAFTSEHMVEIEAAQKLERELNGALIVITMLGDRHERDLTDMTKQRDHYKAACDQYSEDEMLCNMLHEAKRLEHELILMKAQFAEYVKAENAWRLEFDTGKSDDLRIVASKLRIQAMQTLAALKGGSHE
jgi:hypothetical protein